MTRANRLHAEIVGELSCQAMLAAAWVACPACQLAPADLIHLSVHVSDAAHCAITSNSELALSRQQAISEYPELIGALQTGDWPEIAPAAEWEGLACLIDLFRRRGLSLTVGALPLPTEATDANHQMIERLTASRWLVRPAAGHVRTHSPLAISAWGACSRADQADAWQLSRVGYGQKQISGSPEIMLYSGWQAETAYAEDQVYLLAANIDDQNPELYQDCFESLLSAGALDVMVQPVQMKKQRPGAMLTVICRLPDAERLSDIIFRQTSTLGVRRTLAARYMLDRRSVQVAIAGGSVRVKLGYHGEQLQNVAPEYEDCRRLAEATGTPIKFIYQQAIAAFWQDKNTSDLK